MLLSDILKSVHDKKEYRPSKNDSNFNYVHIEDVLDFVRLAYNEGRNSQDNIERNDSGKECQPSGENNKQSIKLPKKAIENITECISNQQDIPVEFKAVLVNDFWDLL
jgi:hypothetical protein